MAGLRVRGTGLIPRVGPAASTGSRPGPDGTPEGCGATDLLGDHHTIGTAAIRGIDESLTAGQATGPARDAVEYFLRSHSHRNRALQDVDDV